MKYALSLVLVLLGSVASAQIPPCISLDPGWTQYYPVGQIQYIGYNLTSQNMAVTFRTTPPSNRLFQNVPQRVAQAVSSLNNADTYFKNNISTIYPEGLLTEYQNSMCPILNENLAWLWTHPVQAVPPTYYYLETDSGVALLSDAGTLLLKG